MTYVYLRNTKILFIIELKVINLRDNLSKPQL